MSATPNKEEIKSKVSDVERQSKARDVRNQADGDDVCSSMRNVINHREAGDDIVGRIVTDSVHERFRQPYVYCPQCKINIGGSKSEIEAHFDQSHFSDHNCLYCNTKVFQYLLIGVDEDGNEYTNPVTHHRCSPRN